MEGGDIGVSNIDERVVKMEFDNKAFEKDASETMSTLDKLKELLKFDNVNKSFDKLTQAANKVDVSNVSEGIETVNAKLSTMQVVGATVISNITSSLMRFGKKVVGGTFGQVIQGGINRAFNIEQAKFTIEGLGKDFVQLKEDINYAVSGTAYGFDEAAKAASMMAASGIEAGDEMKASLRGISGMAAMTGDSYSNIADIFGNIAGKGKLSLQEVNRFATRGINVAAKLAEQFGTTEEVIREMVSKGEIDFRTFAQAMDDAFGTHATEANKTFTGAMSNIKASLSRIGAAFITPMIETNEKDALLIQTFDKLDRKLVNVARDANAAFEGGVNARSAFAKFAKNYEGFTNDSSTMISDLIKGHEKAYIEGLKKSYDVGRASKEQLHEMYLENKKNLKGILDDYSKYTGQTKEEILSSYDSAKRIFIKQLKDLPEYANKTNKELGDLYDKYTGFQYNIVTVLQAFKRMLGVIESSITTSSFLDFFLKKLEKFSEASSLLFNAVAATLSGGILTITEDIKNEKGEIVDTITHEITDTKLWNSFAKVIGMTEADLTNFLDTFRGIKALFDIVVDSVNALVTAISPAGGAFSSVGSIILAITGTIGRLITYIYNVINSTQAVQNAARIIGTVLGGIMYVLKSVVDTVVAIFTKLTSNPILEEIVNTLTIMGGTIATIFTVISDCVEDIIRVFLKPFEDMGGVVETTGGIIDSVLNLIAGGLNVFNQALFNTLTWIVKFIDKFVDFEKILQTSSKFVNILSQGFDYGEVLNNIFGNNEATFDEAVTGMSGAMDKSEKAASKKVGTDQIGKAIGNAIFTGISFAVKALWKGFKFLADNLLSVIDNIDFDKVATFIFDGLTEISDLVIKGINILSKSMNEVGDAIAKIDYASVASKVGSAMSKLIEAVAKVFSNLSVFLSNAIDKMIDNMPALNSSADKIGIAIGKALATGLDLVLTFVPVFVRIIWNALKTLISKLPSIFSKFSKNIAKAFGVSFTGVLAKINNFLKNLSFFDVLKAINLVELAALLKVLIDVALSLKKSINIFASMSNMFNGAGEALKGAATLFKGAYIRSLIVTVGLMVGLAYIIGKLDKAQLAKGLVAMSLVMFILYTFVKHMEVIGPGVTKVIGYNGAMKNLASFIISIAASLALLSILKPMKLFGAVGALGLVLLELVAAINMLNGCERAMASASVLGPLLLSIAGALAILSLFDFTTLMSSALAIAAVLAVLVGLGAVSSLPAVAVGLTVLSTAIAAFGVAVLAVGAGMFLFVSALQTLAMMGQDGSINKLGEAISVLAGCIPTLFEGIGQGILVMVQTLADGATIIADAFMTILQNILTKLLESAQMFATVGVAILLTLLHGILSAIGEITTTVIQIITAFTNNVSANMGEIVDSGMQLMISFINGMAEGLNAHSEEIWAAVKNLVGEIINFILTGLQSVVKEIPFIGDQISDGIEKAKGSIEKFFGDGKIEKETKKSTKGITKAVEGETKTTADKAKKNTDKIPKAMDDAARKSKKSFKGVGKAAGNEFKEIPKMADIADKMTPKGKSSIDAWTKEFAKGATKEKGSDAIKKVKSGAESVDFGPAGTQVFNGFSRSFDYSAWYNQGVKRASAVNKGFKDTEDMQSPSKVWAKYGKYLYEGLANSMRRANAQFYNTGAKAAKGVNAGFNTSIDLLSSLDLDSLSEPTIRPVLDLSGVKMGLNSLDHMMPNSSYALGLAGSMPAANLAGRNITFNNRITVDGTSDPSQWADQFMQELEIQARTL